VQHEAARGIGPDLVGVGAVMPAEGEAAGRRVGGASRADRAGVGLHVGGLAQAAVVRMGSTAMEPPK
jgi:hypothetical protein